MSWECLGLLSHHSCEDKSLEAAVEHHLVSLDTRAYLECPLVLLLLLCPIDHIFQPMLRSFLLALLVDVIVSSPLYRKEHKTAEISIAESLGPIPEEPRIALPPSAIPPATVTQIIPAEEIKQVVSAMVLEQNFDLEMTETKDGMEEPRLPAHKSATGEMEVIRKPAPIIDLTVETLKVKSTPPITTTKKTPTLVESAIDVLHDDKDAEAESFPLDDKNNMIKELEYELPDESDLPLVIKEEKVETTTEKPCDIIVDDFVLPAKPRLPGGAAEDVEWPVDEESIIRIIVYLVSILTEPEMGEPSTWQKIIAGIQCVLRDCREALSLRPTMRIPLNNDGFTIRRARDSMCDCNIEL